QGLSLLSFCVLSGMKFLPQDCTASFVLLLILFQVDQMFFCTFTHFIPAQEIYSNNQSRLYVQKNFNSTGNCMKMCVEELPECVAVSIHNTSGQLHCHFYEATQSIFSYSKDPEVHIYELERSTTNDRCPLADSLFPAY
uniref:WD_REPEATS_REGION domain-containing protein n=1 Tax=Haemonchus contortus TaxID=6289 RepID=A0A7I4Y6R9_HAECO